MIYKIRVLFIPKKVAAESLDSSPRKYVQTTVDASIAYSSSWLCNSHENASHVNPSCTLTHRITNSSAIRCFNRTLLTTHSKSLQAHQAATLRSSRPRSREGSPYCDAGTSWLLQQRQHDFSRVRIQQQQQQQQQEAGRLALYCEAGQPSSQHCQLLL